MYPDFLTKRLVPSRGRGRTSKALASLSTSAKILPNSPPTMRAVTIFIVTLLVLESFYFVTSEPEPGPAFQVKAGRPACYKIPCTKDAECKVGSCSYCNNGLWGDKTCR
ncbi:unnamed protein product [Ixodes persulcatus]